MIFQFMLCRSSSVACRGAAVPGWSIVNGRGQRYQGPGHSATVLWPLHPSFLVSTSLPFAAQFHAPSAILSAGHVAFVFFSSFQLSPTQTEKEERRRKYHSPSRVRADVEGHYAEPFSKVYLYPLPNKNNTTKHSLSIPA